MEIKLKDDFSNWNLKYKTLADFYKAEFDSRYFAFDRYELEIDPAETVEQMNEYDPKRQRLEHTKCALSFPYFAHKYVRILHPKRGLIPFRLFNYQRQVIKDYDAYRFNILRKFRQGGLTTLTEIWGLWRCLYKLEQQVLFLSKTDAEAVVAGEIVNTAVKHMPEWMQPVKNEGKWNDHHKHFAETGGNMRFGTPERARGLAITYLILDEAAFIPDMDKYWKAMYPTLSTGGNCIVISTVNGLGNWYEEMYHGAEDKKNKFHIIDLKYTEHPEYNNEEWVKDQKAQLGMKGWQQEVLGDFLGSGETYIPAHIIGELQRATRNNHPRRRLFQKWVNASEAGEGDVEEWDKDGALWVWREPQDGHEYIMGVDSAEGVGDDGDNSCFQIFDQATLEQVAEFYSNVIQPAQFAQVINEVAVFYNHALVVVENMGPGGAVLSHLQHELFYDNLFYDQHGAKSKIVKPGLKMTPTNRPVLLEAMQYRLMNATIRINSRRLVKELNTFIYNRQTQKIEPNGKGKHDDAIIALCFALYVRDSFLRDLPAGFEPPKDLAASLKNSVLEEIKRELLQGRPKDILGERDYNPRVLLEDDELVSGVVFNFRRKGDRLLKEFGW